MTDQEPKYTMSEFQGFKNAFYAKAYPHLRFGQAFFYHFKDKGMSEVIDPKLFYEIQSHVAEMYILSHYIQDARYDTTN